MSVVVQVYEKDTPEGFHNKVISAYETAGDTSGAIELSWLYKSKERSSLVEVIELLGSYDDSVRIVY